MNEDDDFPLTLSLPDLECLPEMSPSSRPLCETFDPEVDLPGDDGAYNCESPDSLASCPPNLPYSEYLAEVNFLHTPPSPGASESPNVYTRESIGDTRDALGKTRVAQNDIHIKPGPLSKSAKRVLLPKQACVRRHRTARFQTNPPIQGISRPAIRRLARRGGVKRISGSIYAEARRLLQNFVTTLVETTVLYTDHARRTTVSARDVVHALSKLGRTLYGYE
jgi:histone H4